MEDYQLEEVEYDFFDGQGEEECMKHKKLRDAIKMLPEQIRQLAFMLFPNPSVKWIPQMQFMLLRNHGLTEGQILESLREIKTKIPGYPCDQLLAFVEARFHS